MKNAPRRLLIYGLFFPIIDIHIIIYIEHVRNDIDHSSTTIRFLANSKRLPRSVRHSTETCICNFETISKPVPKSHHPYANLYGFSLRRFVVIVSGIFLNLCINELFYDRAFFMRMHLAHSAVYFDDVCFWNRQNRNCLRFLLHNYTRESLRNGRARKSFQSPILL